MDADPMSLRKVDLLGYSLYLLAIDLLDQKQLQVEVVSIVERHQLPLLILLELVNKEKFLEPNAREINLQVLGAHQHSRVK